MKVLNAFDYHQVDLTESHWRSQRSELIDTYLKIDNDDLLHFFRQLAGIPDSAEGLCGWYGANASTFGQMLGAFAKLYLVTGDERLRDKAVTLADNWGLCAHKSQKVIDANGTYTYDKLMGGFLDMLEYLDYAPAKEYIRLLTASAKRRLDTTISRDGLQVMAPDMIEWYTLPEQLCRAWQLTGESMYLNYAKEWDYTYFWDKLAAKDFHIGPRHAYSHVNALSSAARAYEVTGKEVYLQAMKNAYEEILAHWTFATGGYGPAECLFPEEEGFLGDSVKAGWAEDKRHGQYRDFGDNLRFRDDRWGNCEVSCCSWAVFKLTRYLMELTGEAVYGDWAEKLLYNGTGGQLPVTSDGKIMYYADYYVNGAFKSVEDARLQADGSNFTWQCCTGTFPQDVAEYANLLYYQNEKGLYISQYLPSRVSFIRDGNSFTLENTSQYPKEENLSFVLHAEEPKDFSLSFRVPSWAKGRNCAEVNGEEVDTPILPDTWLTLSRTWKDGDTITLSFEWILRFEPVDEYAPDTAALVYGPLVLVSNEMTLFTGDMKHPKTWIKPSKKDGYSFAFCTEPGHVLPYTHLCREFYPYYEVPEMQWYYMYNQFRN